MAEPSPPRAIHPPFFALHAPLAVYAANVSLIAWPAVLQPSAYLLVATAILWTVVALVVRSWTLGAAATSAAVFATFAYGPLANLFGLTGTGVWGVTAWAFFSAMAGWAVLRLARRFSSTTTLLNVAGVAMCGLALASVIATHWAIRAQVRPRIGPGATLAQPERLPDIVLIVLDGYGRTDTFERLYGFSDKPFIDALRERGFYVADQARSNYSQTELSIASSLNLAFVQDLIPDTLSMEEARGVLDALIQDSEVARRLREKGYKTVAVTTGFPALRFENADLVLGSEGGDELYLDALLEKTPFRRSEASMESQFDQRRRLLKAGFANLGELATPSAAPRFIIAHILAPHPPFVFDAKGNEARPKGPFGLWDGNHYLATISDAATYRSGYREQARFIATQTLATIDRLLAHSSRPPIIVLQGDHGPKSRLNQDKLEGSDLGEAYGILNAYLVPEAARSQLDPTITPVNSWRVILGSLLGTPMQRLPDRSYYATWSKPLAFVDVTDRLAAELPRASGAGL